MQNWYIITTTPNHELKVCEKIKSIVDGEFIQDAMVPQEKIFQLVKGSKKEVSKKF